MKLVRAAALLCAAALPLMPVAAQAKTYSHVDPAGDMLAFSETSPDAGTPAPDQANADVVASVVKHRARSVLMQMTYRDLVASQDDIVGHYFAIKTPTMKREVVIFTGSIFGNTGKAQLTKPNGKKVSCRVKHTIDYTQHTATVRVPRKCLGNPRWVKVGMGAFSAQAGSTSGASYVDDALTDGSVASRGPVYTPKIRR